MSKKSIDIELSRVYSKKRITRVSNKQENIKQGVKKMLNNLRKALDSKNISLKAYAAVLGISEKSARNKINEETALTYPEAKQTKTELFPEYDFDYLFASDGSTRKDFVEKIG